MEMKTIYILFASIAILSSTCRSVPIDDPNNCVQTCDVGQFKQVCGTDDLGATRTFNNDCILKTENCLRRSNFQKTADGPCP